MRRGWEFKTTAPKPKRDRKKKRGNGKKASGVVNPPNKILQEVEVQQEFARPDFSDVPASNPAVAQARLKEWAANRLNAMLGYEDSGELVEFVLNSKDLDHLKEMLPDKEGLEFIEELMKRRGALEPQEAPNSGKQGKKSGKKKSKKETAAEKSQGPRTLKTGMKATGRRQCNCMAVEHALVTNCTACGKIVCEVEGEGPCYFCGSYITKDGTVPSQEFLESMLMGEDTGASEMDIINAAIMAGEDPKIKAGLKAAVEHKQKLLSYAANQDSRTNIFDEQSDYYDFENNSWMNEEQKRIAKALAERETERQEREKKEQWVSIDLAAGTVTQKERKTGLEWSAMEVEKKKREAFHEAKVKKEAEATRLMQNGEKGLNKAIASDQDLSKCSAVYTNDTLRGRAKEIYDALRQAREEEKKHDVSGTQRANPEAPSTWGHRLGGRVQHDAQLEDVTVPGLDYSEDEEEEKEVKNGWDNSSDKGVCLSMHQPWASLLVYGLKRFEGRGWNTKYRGRLWIASTSQEVDEDEVREMEGYYQALYGESTKLPFPKTYPKSALLGCVDMVDCWSQEEFQKYKQDNRDLVIESSISQFEFVCCRPRALLLPTSITGNHKLWNLDPKILQGAQKALKAVTEKWFWGINGKGALDPTARVQETGPSSSKGMLDIWPRGMKERLVQAGEYTSIIKAGLSPTTELDAKQAELIQSGMVVIRRCMSLELQQKIINLVRETGLSNAGFYIPTYENNAHQKLQMLCYGQHWNLLTRKYEARRSNFDNQPVPTIPNLLAELSQTLMQIVRDFIQASGSDPLPETYKPEILICNFYSTAVGRLGVHQDRDESPSSLKHGMPILSLSIGDDADFIWGNTREAAESYSIAATSGNGPAGKAKNSQRAGGGLVRLRSGDVMVFGGKSRMVYHGVERIHPNTAPRGLALRPGRLNLTFRVY